LFHASERRIQVSAHRLIVEADDGDLTGYVQPGLATCAHPAIRNPVSRRQHRPRRATPLDPGPHDVVAERFEPVGLFAAYVAPRIMWPWKERHVWRAALSAT
jgi:hypothetical protein